MDMNRRKVLLGMGTAAVGSGAAFGSGAFTQVTADRTMTVSVNGDSSAGVALSAVASTGAISNSGGKGSDELEISPSNGVNDNALTKIGSLDSTNSPSTVTSSTAAFKITNNTQDALDISVSLTGNTTNILTLPTTASSQTSGATTNGTDFTSGNTDLVNNDLSGLSTSGTAYVMVKINTQDSGSDTVGTGSQISAIKFTADYSQYQS